MEDKKLHTTPKAGFSTPDNYFEKSKADILNSLNIENSENKNEDLGFSTPKEYHTTFKNTILDTIKSEEVPVLSIKRNYFKYAIAVAASFLLFFMISKNFDPTEKNTPIVNIVTDTIQEIKNQLPKTFSTVENNDELLAIYVDDSYSDEFLEDYATEDLFFSN